MKLFESCDIPVLEDCDDCLECYRLNIRLTALYNEYCEAENCKGCKHLDKWENEVEYGYPSPCTRCKRRAEDHYTA